MARVSGWQAASVTFASAPGIVLLVQDMSTDDNAEAIDASAFGDGQDMVFIPGQRRSELSITGVLDDAAAIPAPGASAAAITITYAAGQTVSGSGFWTRISKSSNRTDTNKIKGTFQFVGALVRVP